MILSDNEVDYVSKEIEKYLKNQWDISLDNFRPMIEDGVINLHMHFSSGNNRFSFSLIHAEKYSPSPTITVNINLNRFFCCEDHLYKFHGVTLAQEIADFKRGAEALEKVVKATDFEFSEDAEDVVLVLNQGSDKQYILESVINTFNSVNNAIPFLEKAG